MTFARVIVRATAPCTMIQHVKQFKLDRVAMPMYGPQTVIIQLLFSGEVQL